MKGNIFFLLSLLILPSLSAASCLEDYSDLIENSYKDDDIIQHKTTCKPWLATEYIIFATSIERSEGTDLGVIVFNTAKNIIVAANRELDALTNGAIYNTGFIIDTGDYQLNADTLAFGVRVSWRGSSQPNPYNSESLRLYVIKNNELTNVLGGLNIHEYYGEWDTRCAGEFTKRDMSISMTSTESPYADILIKENITKIDSRVVTEGCKDFPRKPAIHEYRLIFNDGHYAIPENLRSIAW